MFLHPSPFTIVTKMVPTSMNFLGHRTWNVLSCCCSFLFLCSMGMYRLYLEMLLMIPTNGHCLIKILDHCSFLLSIVHLRSYQVSRWFTRWINHESSSRFLHNCMGRVCRADTVAVGGVLM
ncbi:hypothetical protein PAHAL_5G366800 [Panicum hallii]|uniref:Uncharacterized protein n=1 Tax=Panicum hallii TaxID=206008 RepID=A0A2S3HVC8_9POAL|nr:hypothetical protein PAHAL_5G366800 [Panicum hallii]